MPKKKRDADVTQTVRQAVTVNVKLDEGRRAKRAKRRKRAAAAAPVPFRPIDVFRGSGSQINNNLSGLGKLLKYDDSALRAKVDDLSSRIRDMYNARQIQAEEAAAAVPVRTQPRPQDVFGTPGFSAQASETGTDELEMSPLEMSPQLGPPPLIDDSPGMEADLPSNSEPALTFVSSEVRFRRPPETPKQQSPTFSVEEIGDNAVLEAFQPLAIEQPQPMFSLPAGGLDQLAEVSRVRTPKPKRADPLEDDPNDGPIRLTPTIPLPPVSRLLPRAMRKPQPTDLAQIEAGMVQLGREPIELGKRKVPASPARLALPAPSSTELLAPTPEIRPRESKQAKVDPEPDPEPVEGLKTEFEEYILDPRLFGRIRDQKELRQIYGRVPKRTKRQREELRQNFRASLVTHLIDNGRLSKEEAFARKKQLNIVLLSELFMGSRPAAWGPRPSE